MGTLWEALDKKNKRRFMLGKGYWGATSIDGGKPMTLAQVVADIEGPVFRDWPRSGSPESWAQFAANVWAFCEVAGWEISIYTDTGDYDSDEEGSWPLVGGRWSPLEPDPCAEQTVAALERARGMR